MRSFSFIFVVVFIVILTVMIILSFAVHFYRKIYADSPIHVFRTPPISPFIAS
jgi:hypothetical protein